MNAGSRGSNHFIKSQSRSYTHQLMDQSVPLSLPLFLLLPLLFHAVFCDGFILKQAPPMAWPDGLQPLQMCTKPIAGNFSFPKSCSKIPWFGSHWTQQGKKSPDQPGPAWHVCPPWSQEGRKARSASPVWTESGGGAVS